MTAFAVAIRWGVIGVATAYALSALPLFALGMTIAGRQIGLEFSRIVSALAPVAMCAVAMGFAVAGITFLLPEHLHRVVALIMKSVAGALLYWILASTFGLRAYVGLRDTLRDYSRRRRTDEGQGAL